MSRSTCATVASVSQPATGRAADPRPIDDGAALPVNHRWLLTIGVMAATIMQILDSTIANVALPHMQSTLGGTADTITWVLTSYIIASAIAIPITGWLSDRLGSRNLFLIAVTGFVLASMLCGLANSLTAMVIFRVLQGVFAAFMNPLSQTVMLDINPPAKQAQAMSIWGMGIMVGPILGPVLGGWLTDNYNWRWVFYVNMPIGIGCFAILWALLPSRPVRRRPFDLFGFTLLAVALSSFQLMLDRGQTQDWFQSWEVWTEGAVALGAAWMFAVHLATARAPMFERALMANRNLMTGMFFMIVVGVLMMATMALLPPMLQRLYGYPVLTTGLLLVPRGVGIVMSMAVAGQLIQRQVDTRLLVGAGLVIAAGSLWQMTQWTLVMGSTPFIVTGFVQGIGLGFVFIPLNLTAFSTLGPEHRTEGSSLMILARNIGASVGISIVTAQLARNIQTSHTDLGAHVTGYSTSAVDPGIAAVLGTTGDGIMSFLDAEVNRQAAMIAYLDDFRLMMILTVVAVPMVILLRRPPRLGPASVEEMAHAAME